MAATVDYWDINSSQNRHHKQSLFYETFLLLHEVQYMEESGRVSSVTENEQI